MAFSRRISAGDAPEVAVRGALRTAFNREPTSVEQLASLQFVQGQIETYASEKNPHERAWNDFCQMLLGSNAFLYVE